MHLSLQKTKKLAAFKRCGMILFVLAVMTVLFSPPSFGLTPEAERETVAEDSRLEVRATHLSEFVRRGVSEMAAEPFPIRLGSVESSSTTWDEEGNCLSRGEIVARAPVLENLPVNSRDDTTDWTPYAGPFEIPESAYLLHRTLIGPRWDEIAEAADNGLTLTLDDLLTPQLPPAAPGAWATEPFPDVEGWTPEMIDSLLNVYFERSRLLQLWWADVITQHGPMVQHGPTVSESMTLFWHDHFATGISGVLLPQSMYIQNRLLRSYALGNFRELTREIYKDPAMLIWLDGQVNRVNDINENFGRELLELFTLGLDQYTQDDIVAAARAFTGWVTFDGITSTFVPEWHDYGYKEFLGNGGYWDGDDIIDIISQQEETARFICRKLYRWFIDQFPSEALIEDLAQTLRDNDYEIRPVLERMFASEHFFDQDYRGSIITDGIDRSIGLLRSLYIEDADLSSFDNPSARWVLFSMDVCGQMLFRPPNVAGWPGYRTWINSYTLPWRKTVDVALIDGAVFEYDIEMQADVLELVGYLSDPNDAELLVDELAIYFFGLEPTELVRERMLDELLQGMEPWEWSINDPEAESRLQGLLRLIFRLPDFQLK